jgi:release factor glutamine methyltransferase
VARVAGFRLTVRPTVFHPRYFLTSEFFANFLSDIDLTAKRVADVGTGSGILALAAARAGAASVVALDINPNAAKVAAEFVCSADRHRQTPSKCWQRPRRTRRSP